MEALNRKVTIVHVQSAVFVRGLGEVSRSSVIDSNERPGLTMTYTAHGILCSAPFGFKAHGKLVDFIIPLANVSAAVLESPKPVVITPSKTELSPT